MMERRCLLCIFRGDVILYIHIYTYVIIDCYNTYTHDITFLLGNNYDQVPSKGCTGCPILLKGEDSDAPGLGELKRESGYLWIILNKSASSYYTTIYTDVCMHA